MLSQKVLLSLGAGDFLKQELRDQVEDEKTWSQKLLKLYRTLRKLEQRKYNGCNFAMEIRQMTSYFAVKHMLYPAITDENISLFSDNTSSIGKVSPKKVHYQSHFQSRDDSVSPARSKSLRPQRLSISSAQQQNFK